MSDDAMPGTAECSFPGDKRSVSDARTWTRAWLEKFCVPAAVIEDAVLVLSELATNAVAHSRSSGPHGTYLVRLRRGVSALRLEVVDAGGVSEPRAQCSQHRGNGNPHPVATASLGEGGHGLVLVEAFTTRWWTRGTPAGRTVGAELALDAGG